jgi:hypothetical protein
VVRFIGDIMYARQTELNRPEFLGGRFV